MSLGVVITRGRMRGDQLVKFEQQQLGNLNQFIRGHQPGEGFVFAALIPDNPKIHQYSADRKAVAIHLAEGRQWFGAVAQELQRRVHQ